jgi:DNA modification methylase
MSDRFDILTGDCREMLQTIPDASVQCCVTSPPYWGLRDYGHPDQIGNEPTPEQYVDNLLTVFREVRRVLRDNGTLWLNLGDSYSSTGGSRPNGSSDGHLGRGNPPIAGSRKAVRKPKDLIGVPWLVAFALQSDGWWLRQDIIWAKPNPMPESVTDRCTKSHEYVFLMSKSDRYYYDQDAIKEGATSEKGKGATGRGKQESAAAVGCNGRQPQQDHSGWIGGNGETRNRRSVWTITTKPYAGAHFATMPPQLAETCVLAGSKPGDLILDPFGGSGTTAAVALKHDRLALIIELNPKYVQLVNGRIRSITDALDQPKMF